MIKLSEIERLRPGHTANRRAYLTKLRETVIAAGYSVHEITDSDLNCYWVRIESNHVTDIPVDGVAMFNELRDDPDIEKLMKKLT